MFHLRIILFLFSFNMFGNGPIVETPLPSRKVIVKLMIVAANNLSECKFEQSLEASSLALKYAIDSDDDYLVAQSYNMIAANYEELSEVDKEIFYYKKGLSYPNRTTNDIIKNSLNNNLGNMYCFEKKNLDQGINYYEKAIEYSTNIASARGTYITKTNLAWA